MLSSPQPSLGLCLVLGLYSRIARLLALVSFGVFGALSLQKAITGVASCSCFGALAVRPWYTFLFDLVAIAALWRWDPGRTGSSARGAGMLSCPRRSILFALLLAPVGIFGACSGAHRNAPLVIVSPGTIEMGELTPGGRKEVGFFITNPGDASVTVGRIEASCACLRIELPTYLLMPEAMVSGRATIDLRAEPDFTGGLAIEVKGFDGSGTVLFATVVNAEVPHG
jgi:hypothetical protein